MNARSHPCTLSFSTRILEVARISVKSFAQVLYRGALISRFSIGSRSSGVRRPQSCEAANFEEAHCRVVCVLVLDAIASRQVSLVYYEDPLACTV